MATSNSFNLHLLWAGSILPHQPPDFLLGRRCGLLSPPPCRGDSHQVRGAFFCVLCSGEEAGRRALPNRQRAGFPNYGARARQGEGRRSRPPPPGPGVSDSRRRQLRIPGLLASSPSAKRDRSSRQAGPPERIRSESGWRAGSPAPAGKIADKGILKQSNFETPVPPRTPRRDPRSRQSLCAARALQDCGSGSFGFASVLI